MPASGDLGAAGGDGGSARATSTARNTDGNAQATSTATGGKWRQRLFGSILIGDPPPVTPAAPHDLLLV